MNRTHIQRDLDRLPLISGSNVGKREVYYILPNAESYEPAPGRLPTRLKFA